MKIKTLLAASLLALSAQAGASTTYTYTGLVYDTIVDVDGIPGTYDTSMSVTGTVELENALAPNFGGDVNLATALGFSFFDGRFTIDKNNYNVPYSTMNFVTDPAGNITAWTITLYSGDPTLITGGMVFMNLTSGDGDFVEIDTCECAPGGRITDYALNIASPGTFATSPVPLPAAAFLFAPALAGLGFMRRRTA